MNKEASIIPDFTYQLIFRYISSLGTTFIVSLFFFFNRLLLSAHFNFLNIPAVCFPDTVLQFLLHCSIPFSLRQFYYVFQSSTTAHSFPYSNKSLLSPFMFFFQSRLHRKHFSLQNSIFLYIYSGFFPNYAIYLICWNPCSWPLPSKHIFHNYFSFFNRFCSN